VSRKTASIAAAIVCFLLLSAASCSTRQLFSESGAPKLTFAGDSITVQATDDINAHYGSTYDVGIHATIGYDANISAAAIRNDATVDIPDIEIINLGTNDSARVAEGVPSFGVPITLDSVLGDLDTFATEFPPSTCVIFVNVDAHNPRWGPTQAQTIDDHMAANPVMYPHVVDWNDALVPADFDKPDSPHPNAAGRAEMLSLEDAAVATCPSTTTTTSTPDTTTTTSTPDTTTTTSTPDTTTSTPDTTTSTSTP
jgi:hypothetical protein